MNILLATDFYYPHIGGTERIAQLLGQELVQRGHQVVLATPQQTGLPQIETDLGIEVHRLPALFTKFPFLSGDHTRQFHPPSPDPVLVSGLKHLVGSKPIDLVHAFGWIAYSAARAIGDVPLVVSVYDYGYTCARRDMLHDGRICDGPTLSKCVKCASRHYGPIKGTLSVGGVKANLPLLRRNVRALNPISHYVNGVVVRDFMRGESTTQSTTTRVIPPVFLHHEHIQAAVDPNLSSILPSVPYILFVGALLPHKGIHVLLEAYQLLASPPPLVLIGTKWPASPSTYPEGITVLQDVPYEQVFFAWRRALFGVMPSLWAEPFGTVVGEAMSVGIPVIGSEVGGHADMVRHGVNGLLVAPGDVTGLKVAMERLISNAAERDRLGAQAEADIKSTFSPSVVVDRFEELYRETIVGT